MICSDELKKRDIGNSLRIIGWRKLKENAQKWSNIDILFSDSIGNDDSAGPSPRIVRDTANPPFVNHEGNDVNSDWLADQWDERSVLGHAQLNKGSMKGDNPTIDTEQTLKRFNWRLALLGKIPKTFTDSIPNKERG